MKPARILVAEDDPTIRCGLVDTLGSEGYDVVPVANGQQAIECFATNAFDLILLDVMMPEVNGYDVCRRVRATNPHIPIIMLTAKGEEIDKVVGLQLGADDYVTKPFGIRELLARVAAVLRRTGQSRDPAQTDSFTALPETFDFGPAHINSASFRVDLGKDTCDLTPREMKLIEYFFRRPQKVISREELLREIWGIDYIGTTRTLDQHIAQLRKKIDPDPANPSVITTVHGYGYRYET